MYNFLAQLYWCLLVTPQNSQLVRDTLVGAALAGLTEGIPYRPWTLETGALCLVPPFRSGEHRRRLTGDHRSLWACRILHAIPNSQFLDRPNRERGR
jgi:hypothetical protein